ncbi:60Kd inner membrane protein-domain-containing protein, partial [Gaertneriomyces semiglobifer]
PTIPSFIAQETVDATQTTLQAVERLGDLKTIGLGGWGPTGMAQNLLELVHVTSGLPWWGTIMVTTLAIRVALFPLMVKVQRTATKMHNISHIAKPLQNDMQRYTSQGDMAQAQKTRQKLADLYKSEGVNPFGAILAFAQIPVFMSFFFGLKAMADLPVPGLSTGGFGWVTDLTLPDSTYILPVAANLGMLAVMEAQAKSGGAAAMQSPTMKNVFRGFMVIAIFLTAKFPAAMFMYWVSSNIFTLLQSLLFRQPAVRRMLNIP